MFGTILINDGYVKLSDEYLFTELDAIVKQNACDELINLGVGDATIALGKTVLKEYLIAVKELGFKTTFRGYGPECGYDFFKEAVAEKYKTRSVILSLDEVFINDGAITDLFTVTTLFKNATALIPNPTYPAYREINTVFGNEIRYINGNISNGFLPMPSDLPINDYGKSFLIYLCSPSNPTGVVYDKTALKSWVDYAIESRSVIIFDTAYESFIRGDYPHSIFEIEGAEKVAIEISSLSKSAGFTGVRCGYSIVKKDFLLDGVSVNKIFKRLKCTSTNGVSYATQVAGTAALSKSGLTESKNATDYYLKNAKGIKDFFIRNNVYAVGGENSPYVFFKCPDGLTSKAFFDVLIKKSKLVVTPGSGFGSQGEGFMRATGFSTRKNTYEAIKRLKRFYS